MKRFFIIVLAFMFLVGAGFALSNSSAQNPDTLTIEQRGCCSWHGGVCGCDYNTGKVKCCDGTLSPTCRCGY